ncbi:MAG: ATP-binding protein, partial [Fretibacterium sp.]|nr:ATP-binding protein [Fretibacterium sp.]
SRYLGESERAIREVFRVARQAAPSILYFDEIESLFPSGDAASATEGRVLGQFLSEMSGIEELQGVTVLATTNRMERLDPSLLAAGRFDLVLELPLPGREAREQIFRIELRGKPTAPGVRPDELAERTEGASGADIALICRRAAMEALKASLARGQETLLIEGAHFEAALKDFQGRRGQGT